MKSLTAVCQTGASMPPINPNGRVTRHPPQRGDGENAEMKMYLSKLKDLVPFMPKNRKLSKLEIIQHVIDYICDLQSELETHPEIGSFDAASALNFNAAQAAESSGDELDAVSAHLLQRQQEQQQQVQNSSPATRQPLVDRQAPNTILPVVVAANNSSSNVAPAAAVQQQQLQQQQQQPPRQQQLSNALTHTAEKDSRQPC